MSLTHKDRQHIRQMIDMVSRSQLGFGDNPNLTGENVIDGIDDALAREFPDYERRPIVGSGYKKKGPSRWMPVMRTRRGTT